MTLQSIEESNEVEYGTIASVQAVPVRVDDVSSDNNSLAANMTGYSKSSSGGKFWTVGTLRYTTRGLIVLFGWLLIGDFVWSMRDRAIGAVSQVMLKKYGASDFMVGLLLVSLPQAIALFLGPTVSCWSDRCRTRWGRRIPFLIIMAPIGALAVIGFAFSPMIGKWFHNLIGASPNTADIFAIATFGVFWTIFDISSITANTVFGGLVNDVVPHNIIGRFYGLFRAASLLAGIIFFYVLMGKAEDYYMAIYLGLGVLYGVGFTSMCFNVKEGGYPAPPSMSGSKGVHPLKSVKSYFYECFSSSYYVWYYMMQAMSALAMTATFIFSVYAARSFGLSLGDYGLCLVFTYIGSLVLSYPLGIMVDKFHPLRMTLLALFLHVLITFCGFFFIVSPTAFAIIFTIQGICAGTYGTCASGLPTRLLPKSRFTQMVSAGGMVASILTIVFAAIFGKFLDIVDHQYQYTFGVGCLFTVLALIAGIYLYRGFLSLGGLKNYVPPEPASIADGENINKLE
ncbi:MAG TPA: MFS transporter [Phycisphaerae bacterium]|nr:MFS transporter [Phycisphaerae bacterium]